MIVVELFVTSIYDKLLVHRIQRLEYVKEKTMERALRGRKVDWIRINKKEEEIGAKLLVTLYLASNHIDFAGDSVAMA